ncbi:MAG: hypothetical protein JNN18_09795 [Rubrivivax sp.]|nr:hypothetical protein [Rubrivivax sp.]
MRREEDDIGTLLKVIAACEVIGGGAALAKAVPDLGPLLRGTATPMALAGAGCFLALLVLSVVAGLLLWRMHDLGLPLSAVVQALQVPYFFLPPWAYHMDRWPASAKCAVSGRASVWRWRGRPLCRCARACGDPHGGLWRYWPCSSDCLSSRRGSTGWSGQPRPSLDS